MIIELFEVVKTPSVITPGKRKRDWMDIHPKKHPYKCLPMPAANEFGWDVSFPFGVEIEWNGGPNIEDITITPLEEGQEISPWIISHFTRGIVTFDVGYIIRTPPEWDLLVQGPPNIIKDGIVPISGIVETSWVPYTFTMNWHFTRPCKVRFDPNEPFCRLIPIQISTVKNMIPITKKLSDDKELEKNHLEYVEKRRSLINKPHGFYTKGYLRKGENVHYVDYSVPDVIEENHKILMTEEPIISKELCQEIIDIFVHNPNWWEKDAVDFYGVKQTFFDDRILDARKLAVRIPELRKPLRQIVEDMKEVIKEAYGREDLGIDLLQVIRWKVGGSMPAHSDNSHPDPKEIHRTPWRELSGVLYLNDDYEGGETFFPQHNIEVRPKAGHFCIFPSDKTHLHGVKEIKNKERFTIVTWFTSDDSQWVMI